MAERKKWGSTWGDKAFVVLLGMIVLAGIDIYNERNHPPMTSGAAQTTIAHQLTDGDLVVPPGRYASVKFTVDAGETATVGGHFTADGGTGNDIDAFLVDADGLANWSNGHRSSAYYSSGRVTAGTISAGPLGPGEYYLVFSNVFSTVSNKVVRTDAFERITH